MAAVLFKQKPASEELFADPKDLLYVCDVSPRSAKLANPRTK